MPIKWCYNIYKIILLEKSILNFIVINLIKNKSNDCECNQDDQI